MASLESYQLSPALATLAAMSQDSAPGYGTVLNGPFHKFGDPAQYISGHGESL